jgi:hypothetical protein
VQEKLEEAYARSGFEKLLVMSQFGTLPDELARKSIAIFAKEVIPRLRRGRPSA